MSERPLVAIVDDDISVRESLPDLLEQVGFSVRAFASAEEFLTADAVDATFKPFSDTALIEAVEAALGMR